MKRQTSHFSLSLLACACSAVITQSAMAYEETGPVTQGDFGGAGVLQTPTARMAPVGQFNFHYSHTSPYSRFNLFFQPLSWLEGGFRYMSISNVPYGPASLSGTQSYKDKAIDIKARLWDEGRYIPAVAVGGRDISGTGLFSGEYVVASKRWSNLDFSLGLGWGYVGARGSLGNPLSLLSARFDERGAAKSGGGKFNFSNYFSGDTSLFGGVSYYIPNSPFIIKAEYDGNNYQHEPRDNNQDQSSPINVGVVYQFNNNIDLQLAWERGNTAMLGFTYKANMAAPFNQTRTDPAPEPLRSPEATSDWQHVATELHNNAGYEVSAIHATDHQVTMTGEQTSYRESSKAKMRAARILANNTSAETDSITIIDTKNGLPLTKSTITRQSLESADDGDITTDELKSQMTLRNPGNSAGNEVYAAKPDQFRYYFWPGLTQNIGGPDAFYLYQVTANATATYTFTPGLDLASTVSVGIVDNFDKFKYDAPSNLPRVRTYIREYLTNSNYGIQNLQLTYRRQLSDNWYGQAYAGLLETMYGGVGGEVLYRPIGQPWALGLDLNYVKQRDFDRGFGFRDYTTTTGHLTGYYNFADQDLLAKISIGQYLAKDKGVTFDVSRYFDNGVSAGFWATFTNVSSEDFGEGSFDKGIYLTIPFDAFFTRSTVKYAPIVWQPLTRDGGQRLQRTSQLYDITRMRDQDLYLDGFNNAYQ
ncbi:YjbH domain-containing protein [Pokkaliibacter sp. MBI-7]|uniref:YjbH domain-containing protein n=1 Tax=Pokkaliibacter sp. MBI-7 TaxID=3040600 RepID=UPI003262D14A